MGIWIDLYQGALILKKNVSSFLLIVTVLLTSTIPCGGGGVPHSRHSQIQNDLKNFEDTRD